MAAMTYESIVAAVRKKLSKADVSSIPGTLAFQVDVEGKAEGIFYIEIKDGQLHVEPYDYHDRNARLIINGTNLMKLVNGQAGSGAGFHHRQAESRRRHQRRYGADSLLKVSGFDRCTDKRCTCFRIKQGRRFFLPFCGGRRCGRFFVSVILVKIPYLFFFFHKRSWKRPANIV